MGAYGGLCVFDHTKFLQTIVPELQAGETQPLVQAAIGWLNAQSTRDHYDFARLADVIAHCSADMTSNTLSEFCVADGVLHRSQAPFSISRQDAEAYWDYEDLCLLFETVLTAHCVPAFANFGLRKHSLRLDLFYDDLKWDPLVYELITLLDTRSRYWAYGSGGYNEGIHGWLSADETQLLLLGLPDVAEFRDTATSETLFAWSYQQSLQNGKLKNVAQWVAFMDWFRRIVSRAVDDNCGLLWGRDLHIFYENAQRPYFNSTVISFDGT